MEYENENVETGFKCNCGCSVDGELHNCPYDVEIGDGTQMCNCCDYCSEQCAMDV